MDLYPALRRQISRTTSVYMKNVLLYNQQQGYLSFISSTQRFISSTSSTYKNIKILMYKHKCLKIKVAHFSLTSAFHMATSLRDDFFIAREEELVSLDFVLHMVEGSQIYSQVDSWNVIHIQVTLLVHHVVCFQLNPPVDLL